MKLTPSDGLDALRMKRYLGGLASSFPTVDWAKFASVNPPAFKALAALNIEFAWTDAYFPRAMYAISTMIEPLSIPTESVYVETRHGGWGAVFKVDLRTPIGMRFAANLGKFVNQAQPFKFGIILTFTEITKDHFSFVSDTISLRGTNPAFLGAILLLFDRQDPESYLYE